MDSTGRIVSSMQQAAKDLGLATPSEQAVKNIIGLGLTECLNILFPGLECHKTISEAYRYQYVEADLTPTPLFEGVEEVLTELKGKGYQLAVATGKARHGLDRVLDESGLRSYFAHTIAADEVANAKPAPDMLELLMDKTLTQASQMVMIGDTGFDLEMAKSAGAHAIGVTFGAQSEEQLIQYERQLIVDNFKDILSLFE
ncbi:MAG: HAD-IA family hydrolase [Gammaproteobacteria bacterium]|nr:HAD-IA family hydrolase [Gammaproteobacteria bacterium]